MQKQEVLKVLKEAKENSKKRNFNQTVDMIVNLKDLNLKKPEQQVDQFIGLHFPRGKENKVCAFVGPELKEQSEKVFDKTIYVEDFAAYAKDKKAVKKLADEFDYFVAQANLMGQVAATFGRVLGPRGKMPNPKAGCVVPPKAALAPLLETLKKMVRGTAKKAMMIQVAVGSESQSEAEVVDNVMTFYNTLTHHLPKEHHNVKEVYLKLTMGKPVKLE